MVVRKIGHFRNVLQMFCSLFNQTFTTFAKMFYEL